MNVFSDFFKDKKEISLCLTSGGARGIAQIGAIEVLEENGFTIKAIAGSSMGSAIGGFYAAGKLPEFKDWIIKLGKSDVFSLFDFTFGSAGFIKGEKIFVELERAMGDAQIEDFDIPYTAVTTDLRKHKEIWIREGSLFKAIRKSVSIPTVLTPVYEGENILVDGGVSSPMPIKPLKDYDYPIVVINVNSNKEYQSTFEPSEQDKAEESEYRKYLNSFTSRWSKYFSTSGNGKHKVEKLGYFTVLNKTIDLMADRIIEGDLNYYKPEMVVQISRHAATTFEFYKAKELIDAGRKACEEALEKAGKS